MSGLHFMNGKCVYLEIGATWLKALHGEDGLELALDRLPNGRLTPACKEKLASAFQNFLKRKSWQPRARAFCALSAHGVSLRRLTVPVAAREEFQRLLLLQIENEFPLPPGELAWGCRPLGQTRQNGATKQELLVIAVKKQVVEEYAEVLAKCGLNPTFTLAALARSRLCRPPIGSCAVLDVSPGTAEAILFEAGIPTAIRAFLRDGAEEGLPPEAEDFLSRSLTRLGNPRLFLSGQINPARGRLSGRFAEVTPLEVTAGGGRSAAVLGLKKAFEQEDGNLLTFQSRQTQARAALEPGVIRKWAIVAAALALSLLLLPFGEAIVLKPLLARKYVALKADTGKLAAIDEELNFLQFLKQNQPPYLDALYICAKSAPQGARFDSTTMNRRGEVSLRGSMRTADQVSEFRSKLIASGFFSSVSVEDQSPSPDRQKVNVRISAQWRPVNERQALKLGPSAQEIEQARTNKDAQAGARMPGGMPPGMSGPPRTASLGPAGQPAAGGGRPNVSPSAEATVAPAAKAPPKPAKE
jgi:hypothetical protein